MPKNPGDQVEVQEQDVEENLEAAEEQEGHEESEDRGRKGIRRAADVGRSQITSRNRGRGGSW